MAAVALVLENQLSPKLSTLVLHLLTSSQKIFINAWQIDSSFLHKDLHNWQDIASHQQGQEK